MSVDVQYFNDFLLEKVNLRGVSIKDLYEKHPSKLPYEMYKRAIKTDAFIELDEAEDKDIILSSGEYTTWFVYNQNVAVTNLPANVTVDWFRKPENAKQTLITAHEFEIAAKTDPTSILKASPRGGWEVVSKLGIFTKWLLLQWSRTTGGVRKRFEEDLEPVAKAFDILVTHKKDLVPTEWVKNPKDINSFKTIADLKRFTEDFQGVIELESKNKILTQSTIIYDDVYHGSHHSHDGDENTIRMHHLTVVIPHTHESSRYWGDNTEWCTAYESPMNYNNYTKQGELFIIIFSNGQEEDKYQFHFESKQFMDSDDSPINLTKFLQDYKEVTNILLNYWQTNIEKKPAYFNNITLCDKTGHVTLKLLQEKKDIDISVLSPEAITRIMAMPKVDKSVLEGYKNTDGLIVKDGQLHIVYIDWGDDELIELFDDECQDTGKSLFEGDFFVDNMDYKDARYIWNDTNSENQSRIIERLSSLEMEYDGEEVVVDTIDEYNVCDILEESEASDILDAMQNAYQTAEISAYESALHDKFTDELEGLLGKFVFLSGDDLLFKTKHLGYSDSKPRTMELTHNLAFKINPSKLVGFYDTIADMDDEWDGSLYSVIKEALKEDGDLLSVNTDYVNYDIDSKTFNDDLEEKLEELGEFIPKFEKDEVDEDEDDEGKDDDEYNDDDEDEEIYTESLRNLKSFDNFK